MRYEFSSILTCLVVATVYCYAHGEEVFGVIAYFLLPICGLASYSIKIMFSKAFVFDASISDRFKVIKLVVIELLLIITSCFLFDLMAREGNNVAGMYLAVACITTNFLVNLIIVEKRYRYNISAIVFALCSGVLFPAIIYAFPVILLLAT